MQRQKSILSFFQKPSVEINKSSGEELTGNLRDTPFFGSKNVSISEKLVRGYGDSSQEISGTETPPEKLPRRILLVNGSTGGSSLFSSIMHKFVKIDSSEKSSERENSREVTSNICSFDKIPNENQLVKLEVPSTDHDKFKFLNSSDKKETILHIESDDDIVGPDTPGTHPLGPHLKRVQEKKIDCKKDGTFLTSTKRVKLQYDSMTLDESRSQIPDATSKFEWLGPSQIRDANGLKPDDPRYDKRTLHIPADALKKMSASQRQYWSVKCQYMDVLIFFKVGKFYELYELDAEIGHKELDWKMTLSGVGKCRQVGVSESGIEDAVQKLVARGYKVGRVEQLETSEQVKAKGVSSVIPRKLIQVITPSTMVDGNIGPGSVHLLAIKEDRSGLDSNSITYGFAFVDCAALKFWVGSIHDDPSSAGLGALVMQVSPKEIIYEAQGLSKEALKAIRKYSTNGCTTSVLTPGTLVTDCQDASQVKIMIQSKGYFKGSSKLWNQTIDIIPQNDVALCALGGLVGHLSRMMLDDVLRNGDILPYHVYKGCLRMDGQTMINLEIFSNNADGGQSGTFYKYLDNCLTSSGKRLLRLWICHPLSDIEAITNRLDLVEGLMTYSEIMLLVAQYLRKLPDLERLIGQIKSTIQSSASLLSPLIHKKIVKQRVKIFGSLVKGLRIGLDLLLLLQKEGHIFLLLKKVFQIPMLDSGKGLDQFLSQFEAAVESDFPSYQNHDVTESDAETLSILIELLIEKVTEWSEVIHALNCIDVLRSFAVTANSARGAMSRPVILQQSTKMSMGPGKKGSVLKITGLWHPFAVVENGELPIPNDIILGEDEDDHKPRTLLLTGPNMGGKSTLLRATCLSVILAQMGCYVPCQNCVLSLVDIIFTRLGATDRIMTGESTFYIECTETASVLQNATQDSLVLLDELGRGTSTFDGYAIAYAVFRHLIEKVNCRLLFATHYHPLTKEFAAHPRVTLQHMACTFESKSDFCSKNNQKLVFLYRLNNGACPESYGLQVATMAGIPDQVVEAASKAGLVMKKSIGGNFRSSERRSEFSTLHEEWLKTLITISQSGDYTCDNDDTFDTLFCLWHELNRSSK